MLQSLRQPCSCWAVGRTNECLAVLFTTTSSFVLESHGTCKASIVKLCKLNVLAHQETNQRPITANQPQLKGNQTSQSNLTRSFQPHRGHFPFNVYFFRFSPLMSSLVARVQTLRWREETSSCPFSAFIDVSITSQLVYSCFLIVTRTYVQTHKFVCAWFFKAKERQEQLF